MFLGHFAVAFAAKKAAPKVSLGALVLGCQLPDFIWPVLVLAGVEKVEIEPGATAFNALNFVSYPISHGLVTNVAFAIATVAITFALTKRRRDALVMGTVVFSHWLLDLIVHRPDLPILFDDGMKVGLGLWNHVLATNLIEFAMFFVGLAMYMSVKPIKSLKDKALFGSLVAFLLLIALGNAFGPQPAVGTPSTAIAGPALAMWLFVAWGWWLERGAE